MYIRPFPSSSPFFAFIVLYTMRFVFNVIARRPRASRVDRTAPATLEPGVIVGETLYKIRPLPHLLAFVCSSQDSTMFFPKTLTIAAAGLSFAMIPHVALGQRGDGKHGKKAHR